MAEVFGIKVEGIDYKIRKGVYALVFDLEENKILTIQNGSIL